MRVESGPVPIFQSAASEAAFFAWYAQALATMRTPHEERDVATPLGRTRVVVAGPAGGEAVVLLHGLGTNAAALAGEIDFFAGEGHRVYAPEIPGEPGRSEPRALRLRDDSHGRWLAAVLDGLGLERARLVGYSLGAFAVLRLAEVAPARIERAVLVVPAGLSRPCLRRALPQLLQRLALLLTGGARWRDRLVRGMFAPGTTPDPALYRLLDATLTHVRLRPRPIPVLSREALARLTAPVLVLPGELDPFFDCAATLAAARRVLPTAQAEALEGTGHVLDLEHRPRFHERALRFLRAQG